MQEISPNSHTLTFPTLLICCSAAEGEGGEEEIYKGHLASAAVVLGGCGGGATASPLNLPLGYGRWLWRWRLWFRVHTVSFTRPRKWGRDLQYTGSRKILTWANDFSYKL